jgi:hypothetical protein
MPSAGFEPAAPATKRPQTYALDRASTEVGTVGLRNLKAEIRVRVLCSFSELGDSVPVFSRKEEPAPPKVSLLRRSGGAYVDK